MTAASVLPLAGLSIWLAVRAPLAAAVATLFALHLGAALLLRRELTEKACAQPGRPFARLERFLAWLALLPTPLWVLLIAVRIFLPAERRKETLTWAAYARRSSDQDGPRDAARGRSTANPLRESRAERGRVSFLRFKCLLAAFDVLALAGLISQLAPRPGVAAGFRLRQWDGLRLLALGRFDLWALAAGAAALGGLAIFGARLARRLGHGAAIDRHGLSEAARALLLAPAAAAAGLLLGPLAAADRMRDFLRCASLTLVAVCIGCVLFAMPGFSRSPDGLREFRWLFLYFALLAALIPLGFLLTTPGAGPVLLGVLAVASPLAHLTLHHHRAVWFLRPWRRGHLFDRAIPLPLRVAGGFLQATAAFPFGGLLLPLALPLRAALASRWKRALRAN